MSVREKLLPILICALATLGLGAARPVDNAVLSVVEVDGSTTTWSRVDPRAGTTTVLARVRGYRPTHRPELSPSATKGMLTLEPVAADGLPATADERRVPSKPSPADILAKRERQLLLEVDFSTGTLRRLQPLVESDLEYVFYDRFERPWAIGETDRDDGREKHYLDHWGRPLDGYFMLAHLYSLATFGWRCVETAGVPGDGGPHFAAQAWFPFARYETHRLAFNNEPIEPQPPPPGWKPARLVAENGIPCRAWNVHDAWPGSLTEKLNRFLPPDFKGDYCAWRKIPFPRATAYLLEFTGDSFDYSKPLVFEHDGMLELAEGMSPGTHFHTPQLRGSNLPLNDGERGYCLYDLETRKLLFRSPSALYASVWPNETPKPFTKDELKTMRESTVF